MFLSLVQNAIEKKNDDGGNQGPTIINPMNRAFNKFNQIDKNLDDKRKYIGEEKKLNMEDIKPMKQIKRFENEVRIELDQFSESSQSKKNFPEGKPSSRVNDMEEGKLSPNDVRTPNYKNSFKLNPVKAQRNFSKFKNMRSEHMTDDENTPSNQFISQSVSPRSKNTAIPLIQLMVGFKEGFSYSKSLVKLFKHDLSKRTKFNKVRQST